MIKVITITSHTNILEKNEKFSETEYPKLNEYLESGYYIKNTIPTLKEVNSSDMYAVTFILEK
jgi:hypothetical protein